jgi:uncharacterized Zn finger protein (UPF0148 family)
MKRSETCSGCKTNPVRGKGQRYCKTCHKEAAKRSRDRIRQELLNYRASRSA